MAWERLCEVNFNGGLRFKDLRRFNVSMLAKQGWRLLNGDNSLVTTLMIAKYFPKTDFLIASLGKNPSYMWRSIYEAHVIIKRASRRMIGNGDDTEVCTTTWLPCHQNGYITSNVPYQLQDMRVVNLMDEGRTRWDEEIFKDIFNDRDIQLIMQVPISA